MPRHERLDFRVRGRLAREVGHVKREEVAGVEEIVHGLQADVVGVHVVGALPAQRPHGGVRLGAHAVGMCVDDEVFAVRLVPDGNDVHAQLLGLHERPQLRLALTGEAVADAHAVLRQDHWFSSFR